MAEKPVRVLASCPLFRRNNGDEANPKSTNIPIVFGQTNRMPVVKLGILRDTQAPLIFSRHGLIAEP